MIQTNQASNHGNQRNLASSGPAINHFGNKIERALDRHFFTCVIAFTIVFFACSIAVDLRMKMWTDELLTLTMAQQASATEIVKATWEGCDGPPPLYSIVVHAILPWIPTEALAVRLPATLGFCGMLLCLPAFCRRRMPASYAMAATLVACIMSLAYSNEGRGYGIILGCAAGALFCWQLAIEGRRKYLALPGFAFCVALMTALHYYAIFFLVPFIVVEVARWKTSRKLDWKLLASMTPVAAVLLLHYPLIAASAKFQKHYWSAATWKHVYFSLGDSSLWFNLNWILCLLWIAVFFTTGKGPLKDHLRRSLRLREWTAMGVFFLLPPLIAILSIYTTHVFVSRYVIWVTPALAVMFVALICAIEDSAPMVGAGFLALFLAMAINNEWTRLSAEPLLRDGNAANAELAQLPSSQDPIVIPNVHAFVELSHYASPAVRQRLLYLLDAGLDQRYLHYDTDALLMGALRHRTSLHIVDLNKGLADHKHFFVTAAPLDYLPNYLASMGWRVKLLHMSPDAALFEVTWTPDAKIPAQ